MNTPSIPFTVTESAWNRLGEILQPEQALRIAVLGGGCSGFQYEYKIEKEAPEASDTILESKESKNLKVLIDEISLPLLQGSVLDWTNKLIGSKFSIENPQAVSGCGCGTSFNLKT